MEFKIFSKRVFCLGLSVFLSLFVVLQTAESQEKPGSNQTGSLYSSSYALVIGIENYEYENIWPSPGKTIRDAVLVGNELEKLGFEVTYRSDLKLNDLENNLRNFFYNKKNDNQSRLFIWYSGHGVTKDDEGFLVPADAPPEGALDFKTKAFPVRSFDELSRRTEAKHVYIVFDSCLADTVFTNKKNDSAEKQITSMLRDPVRQYLCSCPCTKNQKYQNNSKVGTFRERFIKALRNEENADDNEDGYLTASEIGAFLKKMADANKTPPPKFGVLEIKDFDNGEFVFLLPSKPAGYFRDTLIKLKDGGFGPEMIKIPGDSFMMGDLQGRGFKDERPVHMVNIESIAVGRYEVTFEEYDRFCDTVNPQNEMQKQPRRPFDNGWGRGNRPVINVSWEEAVAYTKWLSNQTGVTYRLPTEAEWEYFARAGTNTDYWWGNDIGGGNASCYGCGTRWGGDNEKKTAPVGSFDPNKFDIYDTVGNVWEWTCSEYIEKYNDSNDELNDSKKETDRLEKITTGGEVVALRGGAWDEKPEKCRVSHRKVGYPGARSPNIGFRVVKELK